jgi:hypothetical protein
MNKVLSKNRNMFRLLVLVFVILTLLVLSLQAVSADFSNGPANPGPIVMRFEDTIGLFIPDQSTGISVTIAADVVQDCEIGDPAFELVRIQHLAVPEDANRINEVLHGDDLSATVWPFTEFDCDLFTTVDPIAVGTVDLRGTDNDLVVYLNPDNVNANAFGFMAHGVVYDENGESMRLNTILRAVWDGTNDESYQEITRVNLH